LFKRPAGIKLARGVVGLTNLTNLINRVVEILTGRFMNPIYSAVKRRRSIRKYSSQELPDDLLDRAEENLDKQGEFYSGVSADAHLIKNGRKFQKEISGVIADYGKVEAPHYLALTSESTNRGYVELGYRYEHVVLDLTAQGVGTCWIGKGFGDRELSRYVDIPSGQTSHVLIALGRLPDGEELSEIENPKRKELSYFLVDESPDNLSEGKLQLIDCLRRAPSALNGQPWRVYVDGEVVHLYLKGRSKITKMVLGDLAEMNRVDAGIGLCHLEVGGEEIWGQVEVGEVDHPEIRGLKYVGSLDGIG
jgi:nitroreductase